MAYSRKTTYKRKAPMTRRRTSAKKTTAKRPYRKAAPSKAVKQYVARAMDATRPDMHFKSRHVFEVPLDGPAWSTIFPANTFNMNPVPFTGFGGEDDSGIINLPYALQSRKGVGTYALSELFPRLLCKLKSVYISGQASIPLALSNTPWCKLKIFVFEDKNFDQHQTGNGDIDPPGSNILQDATKSMPFSGTWSPYDISFTPTGEYTDLSASFNSNRFKLLAVHNVNLEQSTQDPTKNLRKFGFKVKHPAYLKFRQSDANNQILPASYAPNLTTPTNYAPIVMAYVVASDGSTSNVSLQLDVSVSIEPPIN